ncbi:MULTISPECIES: MarR family winged helix-turn-helix transcriptional regulator [unclassified Microbacterium]|uniref:MarR family winged helix-turn-helix transcriptional regulator n=1 Tax=unclassified Microbacterium TaxID=2609290 RepID=UPI002469026F|nr:MULTISPECIES: MarR family transcriptional regulator [unclassified Microbacterium]MDH5132527.1 MarR family transcriptional regulator [Microbacterium sp. RD10]MDH5136367.1 MarR family transcriptional regulator [Microbacterium sp. RD11]MDH5146861.1 MarR family transcriptional regulator [Microbacterium sp. RD12]MDH5155717.1 MarR family transcriptional regulator [Microbacterium sp. RD06]MDH5166461.1 MarR family transcriptional regulator [Microbacterium sp. RD02]
MSEARHPRRLDDDELATWLPIIRFVQLLPQVLDRALKDEVGLNHARYAILVTLAGQGEDAVTMTELARIAGLSRSRLSHALDSLEERGWVERTSCSTDKRTLSATLTPAGRDMLRAAAPVHVAQIRELILDPLSAEDRQRLQDILGALLPGVTAAL